jgi:hypothetical protein
VVEFLSASVEVAIVPGSIPASSDTVESGGGAADEAVLNKVLKKFFIKFLKNPPLIISIWLFMFQIGKSSRVIGHVGVRV